MATTYECYPFGLLVTDDAGDSIDKLILVDKTESINVSKPNAQELNDLCESLCGYCGCNFVEYVNENDLTPIYTEQKIDTDTITFELIKQGQTPVLISDSSLGEFVANTKWIADWSLIRDLYGNGTYTIRINYNVLNVQSIENSHKFLLTNADICKSKGQVKLKWWVNGSIQDGRVFDEERYYEARIPAVFSIDTPETETETYKSGQREVKTIQTTINRRYVLQTKLINFEQMDMIVRNIALSDRINIVDNQGTKKDYNDLELKIDQIETLEDKKGTNYYTVEISLIDYKQNLIKRPC